MNPVKYIVRNQSARAVWRSIDDIQVVSTTYRDFRIKTDHIDDLYYNINDGLEELYNVS